MGSIPTRSRHLFTRGPRGIFGNRGGGPALLLLLLLAWTSSAGAQAGKQSGNDVRPVPAGQEADSAGMRPGALPSGVEGPYAPSAGSRPESTEVRRVPADVDTLPWYRRPKWIMFRSVAVPGWGQWANGKKIKAGVVALGEGYLLFRAFDWAHVERDARRKARLHPDDAGLVAFYKAEVDRAASHRRDFTWWSIFAGALSMGDAYVDAHLRNFDVQFKPQDQSFLGAPSWPSSRAASRLPDDLSLALTVTLRIP